VNFEVKLEADSNDITERPHDDKQKPYLCTVCDKRFATKYYMKVHKQIHIGEMLYSCDQCERRFPAQHVLRKHLNIHSGKYKCTECGKCFMNNQKLTKHQRSHSGEKPFQCSVCAKHFATKDSLAVHSRVHKREKPCECCKSATLSKHMGVDAGEKLVDRSYKYKCSLVLV